MIDHEVTPSPGWATKIHCTCGEQSANWMEFYRHRGNAYRDQLVVLQRPQAAAYPRPWDAGSL